MGFFGRRKTQGRGCGVSKSPCGHGHTHSLVLGLFSRRKNPGVSFWGRKKPLRELPHAIPRFSIETGLLAAEKPKGVFLGGGKNPCGKHADSHPGFGQGPVSNLTLKIKYLGKGSNLPLQSSGEIPIISPRRGSNPVPPGCVVRVPDHWAIWRRWAIWPRHPQI